MNSRGMAGVSRGALGKGPEDPYRCPFTREEFKNPVILRCLHTVDEAALEDIASETGQAYVCPVCMAVTADGDIKVNRPLKDLLQSLRTWQKKHLQAGSSKKGSGSSGGSGGVGPKVKISDIEPDVLTTIIEEVRNRPQACPHHPDQSLSLFDLQAQRAVCPFCIIFGPYQNHQCVPLAELEGKVRSSLEDSINRVREKSHSLDKLKRSAEEFLARVEASHREMLEKIDIKEQEIMAELSKRMYTLREQLACAKSSKERAAYELLDLASQHSIRYSEGWKHAQEMLDRSSIFDLFDLKTFLEERLEDMFYLEDPSDRPFSEQPFSVSFPMDSKQLFVNFGRVEADNVFPKLDHVSLENTSTLLGHMGWVWPLCPVGDNLLASGSSDNTIRLWNTRTLECVSLLEKHTDSVCSLTTSSMALYSGGYDGNIVKWDVETGLPLQVVAAHTGEVLCLCTLNKYTLFSGSADTSIKIWNLSGPDGLVSLSGTISRHDGRILALACNDRQLFSASADKTVKIFDLSHSMEQIYDTSIQMESEVWALALSSSLLYAGCSDGTIKVMNPTTGAIVQTIPGHSGPIRGLLVTSQGLVSSCVDGTIMVWSRTTHECLHTIVAHDSYVYGLAVSNNRLFSASQDQTIKVWESISL